MNDQIKTINLDGDKIYMKKSFDGWRVVYPYTDENNNKLWKNILLGGNVWNFIKVLIIIMLILTMTYSYMSDTRWCRNFINDPCEYLYNITTYCTKLKLTPQDIVMPNFTEVKPNG